MKRSQSQSQTQRASQYKKARYTSTPTVISASTVKAAAKRRVEVKRRPDAVIISQISNAWRLDAFPMVAAGDGSINRDGRAIKVLGWEHRITNQTFGNGSTRFVYVLWKEALIPPTAGAIFDIVSGIPQINSTYNVDQAANYTIVADYIHRWENTSPAIEGNEAMVNSCYYHTKPTTFIQTYLGNAITDVCDKALYVFSVNSTNDSLACASQASVSFIDI